MIGNFFATKFVPLIVINPSTPYYQNTQKDI